MTVMFSGWTNICLFSVVRYHNIHLYTICKFLSEKQSYEIISTFEDLLLVNSSRRYSYSVTTHFFLQGYSTHRNRIFNNPRVSSEAVQIKKSYQVQRLHVHVQLRKVKWKFTAFYTIEHFHMTSQ